MSNGGGPTSQLQQQINRKNNNSKIGQGSIKKMQINNHGEQLGSGSLVNVSSSANLQNLNEKNSSKQTANNAIISSSVLEPSSQNRVNNLAG